MGWSAPFRTLACLLVLVPSLSAAADETVTEAEAVRLFLEESPHARRVPVVARSASAARREEGVPSNPEVAYQIEDAAGVRDTFLTVGQALPIPGRRGRIRESAEAAGTAARLAAARELDAVGPAHRASFHDVLYREATVARLREGTGRLDRVVEILAFREREGEGAGYDLLRAEQERAELRIALTEAEGALEVARSRFGAFFAPGRRMAKARLSGTFEPDGPPPQRDEAIEGALAGRADLRALGEAGRSFELDRESALRRRIPEPTLLAGWKRTEASGLADGGFVAALTVPIPVFDRGRFAAARAEAERERVALEAEILARTIRAEVEGALARERAAREAVERLGVDAGARAAELRRIAELAYEEGEAGILELLDAYRTSLAAELRALAVRYDAKRAEIERRYVLGAEVMP